MSPKEKLAVLFYLRSYLGSARCGLVDSKWSAEQQGYGYYLLNELFERVDHDLTANKNAAQQEGSPGCC